MGKGVRETEDLVVSVVRGHRVLGYDDPAIGTLQLTDRLITIVRVTPHTQVAPDSRQPCGRTERSRPGGAGEAGRKVRFAGRGAPRGGAA